MKTKLKKIIISILAVFLLILIFLAGIYFIDVPLNKDLKKQFSESWIDKGNKEENVYYYVI